MSKAYILVDVDGVLNAFRLQGRIRPDGFKLAVVEYPAGRPLPIIYRPEMGAELLQLAADFDAELVWCTTWEGSANQHIAPLVGLPELSWVPLHMPKMTASTGWCKAHSIRRWLEVREEIGEHRLAKPLVWFDDEPDCGFWLNRERLWHNAKWVRCAANRGLRLDELNEARRFLSSELSPAR